MIHPSAIIHPQANIAENVTIGPGAIIEEHVQLGAGCTVQAHAVLTGHTVIGPHCKIGYGAIIGAEPQDAAFKPGTVSHVQIGADCVIREYATIHRGTKEGSSTKIGDGCFLMAGAHVAHNCQVGNRVTLVNHVLLGGYVTVQDLAFLGGAVVVHQFTRIGKLVMVRGQTRIGMDIPPYFMAVDTNAVCGLNRVGMRRNGLNPEQRKAILKAYDMLYTRGLNRNQALERMKHDPALQTEEVRSIITFIEGTSRGICGAIRAGQRSHFHDED